MDLLRAGPAAIREALRADPTLPAFFGPALLADLAAVARPAPSPPPPLPPAADVLRAMAPRWRRWHAAGRVVVTVILASALVWLTFLGVLRLAE